MGHCRRMTGTALTAPSSIRLVEAVERAGGMFVDNYGRPVGLKLPPDLPYETYESIGLMLTEVDDLVRWCCGDWIAYGEDTYKMDMYEQAVALTGMSYNTVQNWASLSRKIPPQRRRGGVRHSVHMEVKALPPADQKRLLTRAYREKIQSSQMRELVKIENGVPPEPIEREICPQCKRPL